MKPSIDNLVIEVTRKCNMQCPHCLRGDAQNMDISKETIENTISKFSYIGDLTITGGEPSLNVAGIRYILETAQKHRVSIGRFYMATNAKQTSNDFISVLLDFALYCDEWDPEEFGDMVHISNDGYHEYDETDDVRRLQLLSFVGKKQIEDFGFYDGALVYEGRATENYADGRRMEPGEYEIENDQIACPDSEVYVGCGGRVVAGCDLSFDTQHNNDDFYIGNVNDPEFEFIPALEAFNKRLEEKGVLV